MLNAVKGAVNIASSLGSKKIQSKSENLKNQRKSVQELFHTRENHALIINLCVKFAKPSIFTGIQTVETGLFNTITV